MRARALTIPAGLLAASVLLAACSSWPEPASGYDRARSALPEPASEDLSRRIDRAAIDLARLGEGDGVRYRPAALREAGTRLDRTRREFAGGLGLDAAAGIAVVERTLADVRSDLAQRKTPAARPPALAARPQD